MSWGKLISTDMVQDAVVMAIAAVGEQQRAQHPERFTPEAIAERKRLRAEHEAAEQERSRIRMEAAEERRRRRGEKLRRHAERGGIQQRNEETAP